MNINRFKFSFFAFLIIVLGLLQVMQPILRVSAVEEDVSWSDESHVSVDNSNFIESASEPCSGTYRLVLVDNDPLSKEVCVVGNGNLRFGGYYDRGTYFTVVGFGLDSKMYIIKTNCVSHKDCFYSAGQDELIIRTNLNSNTSISKNLNIYKNFSKRIYKIEPFSFFKTVYALDYSNPFFPTRLENGYIWTINAMGYSSNGKWLAVELSERGFGLINLETFNIKRISSFSFRYGIGMDPAIQMTVSNDGKHIVLSGVQDNLTFFDINTGCGLAPTSDNMIEKPNTIIDSCVYTNFNTNKIKTRFRNSYQPVLNENGSELIIKVNTYDDFNKFYKITLRTKGYVTPKLGYLALGDSFSSGEGEHDDNNYVIGTNVENEKCHTSLRSYPYVISYNLNINSIYMKNVACSGATTNDITGEDYDYWGQGDRLVVTVPNKSIPQKTNLQSIANDTFLPGRIHQETFVKNYQPKVITVGIGGNDVGFADKLKACLSPGTCSWAGNADSREKTAVEMKGLFNKLASTYQGLQKDSPDAKIYAIGYPRFIEPFGQCSQLQGVLLDTAERLFIDQGVIYMNQIIEAAAKKVGIKYISIENSFGNHKLCGSDWQKSANFIAAGDDIGIPVDWLEWVKLVGQESFHPNALGHQLVAAAILNSVSDISNYDYCEVATPCSQDVTVPEPSTYWVPDTYHDYPAQKLSYFVYNKTSDTKDFTIKQLRFDDYSLAPNSLINVEINSTPRSLGQFLTTADGSIDVDINLPSDLEEGFHTVHMYGKSYSGEDIDLYQVIRYFKPNPVEENMMPISNFGNKANSGISVSDTSLISSKSGIDEAGAINQDDLFQKESIWGTGYLNPSILSSGVAKKASNKINGDNGGYINKSLCDVIAATFCALLISILSAAIFHFYKKSI